VKMRSLFLALLAPVVAVAQDGPRPISIDEAVALARRNQPSAVSARGQLRTSSAALRQLYSQFLPSLSASWSTSRSGGESFFQGQFVPFRGDPWSYSQGLNSSLEIFDLGRLNELRSARSNIDAAEAAGVQQEFSISLLVKQQYYAILSAREAEAAARTQLAQAQQQFAVANARVAAGAATISDSLQSVIQVGNAQLAVLNAQNQLNNANVALTRLVATPFVVTAIATDTIDPAPVRVDSTELVALVLRGPAVRQAEAQLAAAKATSKVRKSVYAPTVSMSGSFRRNNASPSFDWGAGPMSSNHSLGFSVNYPIFNNYSREQQIIAAKVGEDNAEASLRDAQFVARQNLITQLGNLRTAETRIMIQRASVAAAEEDLRVQQERYSLGASTLLQLLTSQNTLNSSRAALIQARLDARVARAQIEALIGRTLQ
jgi:outer membrane protein